MFKKSGVLGFALSVLTMLAPSMIQGAYHPTHYPKGYYYYRGHWRPYRGYGHPYRGGYYDQWGRWHR